MSAAMTFIKKFKFLGLDKPPKAPVMKTYGIIGTVLYQRVKMKGEQETLLVKPEDAAKISLPENANLFLEITTYKKVLLAFYPSHSEFVPTEFVIENDKDLRWTKKGAFVQWALEKKEDFKINVANVNYVNTTIEIDYLYGKFSKPIPEKDYPRL